jgi:hypothetical protein
VKQGLTQALEHLNIQHASRGIEDDDALCADQQR